MGGGLKVDADNGRWFVYGYADKQLYTSVDPLPGDDSTDDDNAWIMEREICSNNIIFRSSLDDGDFATISDVFLDATGYPNAFSKS